MSKTIKNNNADFEHVLFLIKEAKNRIYVKANAELVLLYYNVGKIVSAKVNAGNWGESTVQELAHYIAKEYPELSGFNRRGLYRMKQFFELYSPESDVYKLWLASANKKVSPIATQFNGTKTNDSEDVSPLATQFQDSENQYGLFISAVLAKISWTNHLEIFSATKQPEQILFYLLMTIKEKWNKLEVRRQIKSASFERTVLSNKMVSMPIAQLSENLFKDPYIFEFLNLPDGHTEKEFEKAITLNLQKFILEVGKGFTYMGNQYRLQIGNRDYHTDLLFYHRDLQCLVLFELKIEEFEPEFLGKLNFYLEALDRDVKRPNENPSIGILLCKGKDNEIVEYAMARNTSPAIIAEYETKLIDKKILANKLHQLAALLNKEME